MVVIGARKHRVIGLKVTGTLMLNFINPKSAAFSLGLAMHDNSSYYGLNFKVVMFGLPLKNVSNGHEILSVTTSKNVTLTLGVGCFTLSCYG